MAFVAPRRPMLKDLPVGLFGAMMGLTGLSVAWRLATHAIARLNGSHWKLPPQR